MIEAASLNPNIDPGALSPTRRARRNDGIPTIDITDVSFSVHDDLVGVETLWREFEQAASCTVFQTFDWLSTWQRCIGDGNGTRPAIVVGRGFQGKTLFILPLSVRSAGLARELTFLGSELCDYNAPLLAVDFGRRVAPARFADLWRSIAGRLQSHAGLRYDLVRLEKMPASIGALANPLLQLGVTLNPSGAYLTHLGDSWDAYYAAKRSATTRSRDRNKRKRLAAVGEITLASPTETNDILATLDTLVQQKSQSFARMGVANLFARPGYLEFYRAIVTDPKLRALAHVSRLQIGTAVVAANLGLTFRDRYHHVLASHTDGELSRLGPGTLHLHELMRHAINCDFRVFDFTIGDEAYKRDWSDTRLDLYDHVAIASGRGALVGLPLRTAVRFKRWIKQTPMAWRLFSEARSRLGAIRRRVRHGSAGRVAATSRFDK